MPTGQKADYSKSIIYKICCRDPTISDIYVGGTTNFVNRKNKHKGGVHNTNHKDYNSYKYTFMRVNGGWDNWDMIQIEQVNCKSKRELEVRERYWIETLKSSLNKYIPTRGRKEYKKMWDQKNKEIISQKGRKKIMCECGRLSSTWHIRRHTKSRIHLTRMNAINVIQNFFLKHTKMIQRNNYINI